MKELGGNPPPDGPTEILVVAVKAAVPSKVYLSNEALLHALCPPLMRELGKRQDSREHSTFH